MSLAAFVRGYGGLGSLERYDGLPKDIGFLYFENQSVPPFVPPFRQCCYKDALKIEPPLQR